MTNQIQMFEMARSYSFYASTMNRNMSETQSPCWIRIAVLQITIMAITNFLPKTRHLIDSICSFLETKPALYNFVLRIAQRHDNWMDYRKYGLMRDDLLPAENPVVLEALSRLPDKESFDRTFRLRRAVQLHMNHEYLPANEQISQEKDYPYLWPKIEAVCKERDEKELFDSLVPTDGAAMKRSLNGILQKQQQ